MSLSNGVNGVNGVSGANGVNGVDGENVVHGMCGVNGMNGVVSINGEDGANGVSGKHARPQVLLIGDIQLAHEEWRTLGEIAELRVRYDEPHCAEDHLKSLFSKSGTVVDVNSSMTVEMASSMAWSLFLEHMILRR